MVPDRLTCGVFEDVTLEHQIIWLNNLLRTTPSLAQIPTLQSHNNGRESFWHIQGILISISQIRKLLLCEKCKSIKKAAITRFLEGEEDTIFYTLQRPDCSKISCFCCLIQRMMKTKRRNKNRSWNGSFYFRKPICNTKVISVELLRLKGGTLKENDYI